MGYCMIPYMTEPVYANAKKETAHNCAPVSKYEELDADLVIKAMKKVGHRNSEGLLILPKYYDDDLCE